MIIPSGYLLQLITGTLVTIKLAVTAFCFGMLGGLLFSLVESIPNTILRRSISSVIFLIRATPELLILFFIYFGLATVFQTLFQQSIDLNPFTAGVIALSLIFSAYASQVFRGAFQAIDQGQIEAANALGLSKFQQFFWIQLPQAWRHALPGIGNLWLVLLKDTAIVMLIGLSDLMGNAKIISSSTREPFLYFFITALIYLVISSVSEFIINVLTKRSSRYVVQHEHHELFA